MVIESTLPFLIGIVASIIMAVIGTLFASRTERLRKERTPTLEDRIATLLENLKSSSSVVSDIEAEIEKRREIAEKLKDDVQRYEQLREINQSQVEAIAQTIRGEMVAESRKSLWRNAIVTFVIALVFFFLGLWVGGM